MATPNNLFDKAPLSKSKGAVRNLTQQFIKCKHSEEFDPRDRFKPLKTNFLQGLSSAGANYTPGNSSYSGINSPQETEKLTADNNRLLPMSTKASSEDSSIEYGKRFLPPIWVDIQEDIERHFEDIFQKRNELERLQQKRMKVKFDDDEDDSHLQRSIYSITDEVTDLVKASEAKLKELIKVESDDKTDEQIRKNIQISLATRLKDIASEMRKKEKQHYLRVQEIQGEDSVLISEKEKQNFMNDEGQMQALEEEEDISYQQKTKSKEIQRLVNTINDLAVIFKDLQQLVVEQGTILDRIDFNVEQAHKDVKQGVVHLEKTKELEKSTRAKSVIMCLLTTIFILTILMVIKHT